MTLSSVSRNAMRPRHSAAPQLAADEDIEPTAKTTDRNEVRRHGRRRHSAGNRAILWPSRTEVAGCSRRRQRRGRERTQIGVAQLLRQRWVLDRRAQRSQQTRSDAPRSNFKIRRVCGPATRETAAIPPLRRWTKPDGKLLNYDVTELARRECRRREARKGATRSRLLCVAVVESSSLARAGVSTRRRGLIRTSRHSWHWSCCH